jgi:hypothetical protein
MDTGKEMEQQNSNSLLMGVQRKNIILENCIHYDPDIHI